MADRPQTTSLTEHTNRVIAVTRHDLLLEVRHKFATLPAADFGVWLQRMVENSAQT